MSPSTERVSRYIVFTVLGGLGAWVGAAWVWPWCGPWLFQPCPLATALGCKVVLVAGGVWGAGEAWKLDLRERSQQLRGIVHSSQLAAMRRRK